MKKISILCLTIFSFLFSQSQVVYLKGRLDSTQTGSNSTATGVVIVKYDKTTKMLKLWGDYAGLSTSIAAAHIHRVEPGVNPIVTPLTFTTPGDTTGTLTGTATFTKAQEDSLLAGNMYVNVHTSTNQDGEIRALLTLATDQRVTFLTGRLQSAQEVPPNSSLGKGSVYALLDLGTDSIFLTGDYTGLTGASTMAHVHTAPPASAGPVLFPIHHSFASAGVVHAAEHVDANGALAIVTGGSYVNVHTQQNPNGEIRAQLINNETGRFFVGEFSAANEAQPSTASRGRGVVIVSYDPVVKLLQLFGDYQHLEDTVTRAILVTPGAPTPNDSILLVNSRDSIGTISMQAATLTTEQADALLGGTAYVNIFSKANPQGEIRANLTATTPGETQAFAIKLDQAQEVPTNTGAATGNAFVLLDKTTGMTYVTGSFQGLNSASTRAYIRGGAVGDTSGSVFLDVTPAYLSAEKTGTFSGMGIVQPQAIDSMINGLSYVNVLSVGLPKGAVRGQLGNLILPLKLKYFNGYKQRNEVQLVWETAEELNVSRFEVEQLNTQNNSWNTKGTVYPKGGNGGSTYSFNDVPTVNGGKYLIYRLKMIDKDGKFTYSSLVKINFDKVKAELFIQTNPVVNGELKYTITGLSSGRKAEVSIIDYNGKLILRNTISSLMNNTIRIPQLPSGMYKLMIRVDDTLLQQGFIK